MTSPNLAVAVVDDDAAVCNSTRFLLEIYDLEVQTYQSGAKFLRDTPAIACLIVDYHMPDLNGLDVVSELRRRGSQVPTIIMITATTDPDCRTPGGRTRNQASAEKTLIQSGVARCDPGRVGIARDP